jgi:serine/threonine-protein kinase
MASRVLPDDPTMDASLVPPVDPEGGPIWPPGKLLGGGAYEVRRRLGTGGMGEVYEGYDRGLDRIVAIKALHRGLDAERIRQEARALAACRHPGVATAYALSCEDGVDYLVMERVYGVTLAALIDQRTANGTPLRVAEALDLLIGLTEAVGAIHAAGIAHRDLKPENIIVAPGGRVVVIDFGIFAAECASRPAGITGTPCYMAPESVSDQVRAGAGHLVDLYAIGVMAFEMLTGAPPFVGSPGDVMMSHVVDDVPDILARRPDVSPALARIIGELLRKDPDERPQDVDPLLLRLRALRSEAAAPVAQVTPATRARLQTFSVLVVDDDANARILTDRIVRRTVPEAEVVTVGDGASAVRLATQRTPHLLLLDLDMPGMNGIEVCLALRGTRSADQMAIVLVSGRADHHDLSLLRQLGVRRSVVKGPDLGRSLAAAVLAVRAAS